MGVAGQLYHVTFLVSPTLKIKPEQMIAKYNTVLMLPWVRRLLPAT
jgi:hypothetical protein